MERENMPDLYKDNRDASRQSLQSTKKESRASSAHKHKKHQRDETESDEEKESCVQSRSKTRIQHSDPDRDQVSDGESRRQSTGSFYSEDYENESLSDRSCSPYSQSRSPSPVPRRGLLQAKKIPNSLPQKTGGVGRHGMTRPQRPSGQPLTQQHRRGVRSHSKESSPPKDLDLVTKRMLSARLLKIGELRNALAELQQRNDELQKENRILRQLQVRQEKALQRFDDTESEISQLLSRHSNDIQVLRERLRRTQGRERAAEKRMKESEEQLQRSQATVARLKKLISQRELGERDELSRRLEEEKTRAQEAEGRIKELERSIELSTSSFQRQLVAEKRKTVGAQEEIQTLREELDQLSNKLRDKERELDVKNIYANRMAKPSLRKEVDVASVRKAPSRNSSKAVQTEGRVSSLDFPTPPPALSDVHESCEPAPDEYLSLKEPDRADRPPDWEEQSSRGRERDKEKEEQKQQLNVLEERAKRLREASKKENVEEDRKKTNFLLNMAEKGGYRKQGHVQDEVEKWNQENLPSQQAAEEARRRKDKLLAKMREIDLQSHGAEDLMFAGSGRSESANDSSPRPPGQRKRDSFIFSLTELEGSVAGNAGSKETGGRRSGVESDAVSAGIARRAPRSQISSEDLAFGGYAPSFGSRVSPGFPPTPPKEEGDVTSDATFSLREAEAEKVGGSGRKFSLMQQLFRGQTAPAGGGLSAVGKMEVLNSPAATNGVRSRREGLLSFSSGSNTPPATSVSSLHVADSRPAVCAITSFDDDIEELTL